MDLLRKSYPSVVLRSPPPATLSSVLIQSWLLRSLLYIFAEGSVAGQGAALRGLLHSRGRL